MKIQGFQVGIAAAMLWMLGLLSPVAVAAADSAYRILPGDNLNISVWKEQDLQADVLVRPDGVFSFPLAGDIDVTGKTVEQVREELKQKLEKFVPDLVVTVMVRSIDGNKMYVIGQVARPGAFVANSRIDVMQALSIAGGTTPFASLNSIKILRRVNGEAMTLPFRYGEVEDGRNLEQNIILQPGDVVVVP